MWTRYVRYGGGVMLNFSGNSVEYSENTHCVAHGFLDIRNANEYLCGMFIKAVQKRKAGTDENPLYFRLCESYRDSSGKPCLRMIIALDYMEDLPRRSDKQQLCRCPNDMALHNRHPMCDNPRLIELANHYYQKTVDSNRITPVRETEAANQKEAECRKQEEVVIYTKGKGMRKSTRIVKSG
jgi:hypothetical protein